MNKLTFIGDPHGKVNEYKALTEKYKKTICVGDFGFKTQWEWHKKNIDPAYHWIVPGNHDYPPMFHEDFCLGNFKFIPEFNLFTVRGADSIDKHLRTEGIDWFENEELTYPEGLECLDLYEKCKPNIVVSHDCPQSVMTSLFGYPDKSRTRQLLESMFEIHQPNLWVFGHHHRSKDVQILGTRFVCLAELETLTIEI